MDSGTVRVGNSRLGGLRRVELFGNPGTREGRSKGGSSTAAFFRENPVLAKKNGFVVRKEIALPHKSRALAELVGIILGDGGVRSKYQLTITFNGETDREYARYIGKLIKELFHIDFRVQKRRGNKGADIVVSSVNFVEFLRTVGIQDGNKVRKQVGFPEWIMQDPEFQRACVRGLMDTDGSLYSHRYKSYNKYYEYLKLCFTNCSRPLLQSVYLVLTNSGIKASLVGNHVSIHSANDVKKYFSVIGSSNPKFLEKYKRFFGEVAERSIAVAC